MGGPSLNLLVIRSPDIDRFARFYQLLGLTFIKHAELGRMGNGTPLPVPLCTLILLMTAIARGDEATPPVRTLTGHSGSVMSVSFSPNGATLASSSRDHTVKFWDPKTGNLIKSLTTHDSDVYCVTYSPKAD